MGRYEPDAMNPGSLGHYWRSLGRPSSLDLRVPLWYAPIGAIGPLLLDRPVSGGDFYPWLWVAVCGELVLLAYFPLARLIVHGRSGPGGSRPAPNLIAILGAAILRGLVVAILAQQLIGSTLASEISYRLAAAVLFQPGFLILIALLANDRDDHRNLVGALRERERQLTELEATAAERLARMHQQLVDQVHQTIDPQVDRLLQGLSNRPGVEPRTLVAQLIDFADNEVRPLSHRLASGSTIDVPILIQQQPSPRVRSPLPRRLAVVDCLLTRPSVWVIFAAAVIGAIRNAAPGQQVTFILGMTGTTLLGLLIARRAAIRWSPPTPITVCFVVLLNLALPTLAVWILHREGITGTNTIWTAAAVGAAIGVFSVGYGAVSQGRIQTQEELQDAVARLEASVNVLRQKAWVTRRQLGYVMHGAIQGALLSAAMRLSSADCIDARLVASISHELRQALARLDAQSTPRIDFEVTMGELQSLWSGECELELAVQDAARIQLASRPETAACAAEVVREAVGNAIRHGRANRVWVTVSVTEQLVHLEVIDDGGGLEGCSRPGLGAAMCDEMCLDWSLTRESDRTVLAARLALAQDPERRDAYPASGAGITQAPEQRAHALGARTHGTQVMDAS